MRWSTGWALDQASPSNESPSAGTVILSAGFDRMVEIDGLFESDIALLELWAGGEPVDTSTAPRHLLDQLIGLGVLVSAIANPGDGSSDGATDGRRDGAVTSVVVVGGGVADALAAAVAARLGSFDRLDAIMTPDGSGDWATTPDSGADLVVALRTHERIELDHCQDRPILHVDLRHEHTLVVGPTELPGLSACDTCYDTRLARRWRTPTLPERPGVLGSQELLAELIAFHAATFVADGSHLVNATIAHSLRDGTANLDALLRVPGCPGCGPQRSTDGRVRLPWVP